MKLKALSAADLPHSQQQAKEVKEKNPIKEPNGESEVVNKESVLWLRCKDTRSVLWRSKRAALTLSIFHCIYPFTTCKTRAIFFILNLLLLHCIREEMKESERNMKGEEFFSLKKSDHAAAYGMCEVFFFLNFRVIFMRL